MIMNPHGGQVRSVRALARRCANSADDSARLHARPVAAPTPFDAESENQSQPRPGQRSSLERISASFQVPVFAARRARNGRRVLTEVIHQCAGVRTQMGVSAGYNVGLFYKSSIFQEGQVNSRVSFKTCGEKRRNTLQSQLSQARTQPGLTFDLSFSTPLDCVYPRSAGL